LPPSTKPTLAGLSCAAEAVDQSIRRFSGGSVAAPVQRAQGVATMTREESWQVTGSTLELLTRISSAGYVVSVHRIPPSLLGTFEEFVEMHAINISLDPPIQQMARVSVGEAEDIDYQCACLLAEAVGVIQP
jgi:hypothetical protein